MKFKLTGTKTEKFLIISILIYVFSGVFHQSVAQSIQAESRYAQKFALYNALYPSGELFVHFDKTVYVKNENVWFAAYLVNADSANFYRQKVISVVLANDQKIIYSKSKFLMSADKSSGSFEIPDTIPPGKYNLIAFLDQLDKKGLPCYQFCQRIEIKSNSVKPTISIIAKQQDKDIKGTFTYMLKLTPPVNNPEFKLENLPIRYTISGKERTGKINKEGKFLIELPADQTRVNGKLSVDIGEKSASIHEEINLISPSDLERVNFYPEGGSLAEGLINQVAMEFKGKSGEPEAQKYYLLENAKPIDTINTGKQGTAVFWITPKAGSQYSVMPYKDKTKEYKLPSAVFGIPSIHIKEGVVEDTLSIRLASIQPRRFRILVHNFKDIFADLPATVSKNSLSLKLVVKKLPVGIAAITVLDEQDRPQAERLFFVHYKARQKLNITTDKQSYGKREKVTLKIKLFPQEGSSSLSGSVACVREDRLNPEESQDIRTFIYLEKDMRKAGFRLTDDLNGQHELENLLLIKGWRKYRWNELANVKRQDTVGAIKIPEVRGSVKSFNKSINKSAILRISGSDSGSIVSTDIKGNFILTPELLLTQTTRPLRIAAYGVSGANITINDQFASLFQNVINDYDDKQPLIPDNPRTSKIPIAGLENMIEMKEVRIKSSPLGSGDFSLRKEKTGKNQCGDYICQYNCLMCPFPDHCRITYIPIKGKVYQRHIVIGGVIVRNPQAVYYGCELEEKPGNIAKIEGLLKEKEFYPIDENVAKSESPLYQTTLYWNPAVQFNTNGTAECSFYTGDVKATYKVILQGKNREDVFFSEQAFDVSF